MYKIRPGDAPIKSQFIKQNVLNSFFPEPYENSQALDPDAFIQKSLIAAESQQEKRKLDSEDNNPTQNSVEILETGANDSESTAKRPKIETDETAIHEQTPTSESVSSSAVKKDESNESKKQKNRGMNTNRKFAHVKDAIKLCTGFLNDDACSFENCKFSHDIPSYMESKAEDVGPNCHLFDTFGKCSFGIKCRFAMAHTTAAPEYKQIVDEEKVNRVEKIEDTVLNVIDKFKQREIAKIGKARVEDKVVDFDKAMDQVQSERKQIKEAREKLKMRQTAESSEGVQGPVQGNQEQNESVEQNDTEAKVSEKINKIAPEPYIKLRPNEKPHIDFRQKLYLAPLTTVGNLPFRRLCVQFGADITCGEMSLTKALLQSNSPEWTHMRRHKSEKIFGVQLAGNAPHLIATIASKLNQFCPDVDFVDLNCGCPIDMLVKSGAGSALMERQSKMCDIVAGMNYIFDCNVTVKMRMGFMDGKPVAHKLVPKLRKAGASLITLHGRSREQRYSKEADWGYIQKCADLGKADLYDDDGTEIRKVPVFGNGDILDQMQYWDKIEKGYADGVMIGRGALIKPWVFTEIKERRIWDIRSGERLEVLKDFAKFGIEQWGSDTQGINTTRRFMLEQISFMHRYIPVGLLDVLPQKINERPPTFYGRDALETMMGSTNVATWIKITEMILGKAPDDFIFTPKHKANSFTESEG
ncbi:tRNA-dihydrouridine(47) synthase [NAD(P)(+)]-like protein [Nowakowskiella sp. JEL0407]|nr:tRNA-dihydrouridine(47) synthase [NAD(P)(+)]-like protein [Nowakowskiella sp. JEL0407]